MRRFKKGTERVKKKKDLKWSFGTGWIENIGKGDAADLVARVGWCYEHDQGSELGCSEEFQRLEENRV